MSLDDDIEGEARIQRGIGHSLKRTVGGDGQFGSCIDPGDCSQQVGGESPVEVQPIGNPCGEISASAGEGHFGWTQAADCG